MQFTTTVTGTTNSSVSWMVQEGAAGGGVSSTGLYTAPSTAGTYHVVATSAADSTKSGTATITVTVPVTPTQPPSPAPPSLTTGTGATHAPSYITVTGGGAMPSTSGAPLASCFGNGSTDDTVCLQSAIKSEGNSG